MTEFSNTSASLARRALAGSTVYLDANVLVELKNFKTGLEYLINETAGRLEQIAKLAVSSLAISSPELDGLLITDRDFSSLTVPQPVSEQVNVLWQPQATPSQVNGCLPPLTASDWFECRRLQTMGPSNAARASDDDLISCQMPTEFTSTLYPIGYLTSFDTDPAFVSPFVFLPCFLLLREISEYEALRALVVVAIATLFLRLRSAGVSHAIAVCQRSFFTHHGAHPPANRSQRHLGPFLGRVLQPQVAA